MLFLNLVINNAINALSLNFIIETNNITIANKNTPIDLSSFSLDDEEINLIKQNILKFAELTPNLFSLREKIFKKDEYSSEIEILNKYTSLYFQLTTLFFQKRNYKISLLHMFLFRLKLNIYQELQMIYL